MCQGRGGCDRKMKYGTEYRIQGWNSEAVLDSGIPQNSFKMIN
jgi:hypothetical protein